VETGAISEPTDLAESELQDVLEGSTLGVGKCRSDDELNSSVDSDEKRCYPVIINNLIAVLLKLKAGPRYCVSCQVLPPVCRSVGRLFALSLVSERVVAFPILWNALEIELGG
jgi:hypothetical protein